MSNQLISETREGNVLELALQFNENNVFSKEAFQALDAALEKAAADETLRSLLLTSNSKGFLSNGLDPHAVHGKSEGEIKELIDLFFSVLRRLFFFPVPVVCAINGHAIGYGGMLALFSDFRFMLDRGARISYPEINIGISLPVFVTQVLVNLVGEKNARDLLFLGKALKGPDALAMGLVDELHSAEDLPAKARARAAKLAGLPALAARDMKANMRFRYSGDIEAILEKDIRDTAGLMFSDDAKEGFASIIEKRRPKFS